MTDRRSWWLFFALVYCWSWTFWTFVALTGRPYTASPVVVLFVLGALGLPPTGILLSQIRQTGSYRRDY